MSKPTCSPPACKGMVEYSLVPVEVCKFADNQATS